MSQNYDLASGEIERQIERLIAQLNSNYPGQHIYLDLITYLMISARKSGVSKRHLQLVVDDALEISEKFSTLDNWHDIRLLNCHLHHLSNLKE